jgi:hypothetical protein
MRKLLFLTFTLAACGTDASSGDDMQQQPPPGGVVYYGQVDKILNESCVDCHSASPDRLAPFSLASYTDAVAAAKSQAVSYFVKTRQMPPYFADNSGACSSFTSPWLADADIATLAAWFDGDQAAGDPATASPAPGTPPELAHVDATLDPGAAFTPHTGVTDEYRCFIVDPKIATDKFLTGNHVHPGDATIVHHVVVFSLPDAAAEAQAQALDDADPDLGYDCFGGPGVDTASFLTGWAPGQSAVLFPADTGLRITGGRKLIVQMHYNLTNSDGNSDRTTIDLQLADTVTSEAKILRTSAPIDLPPHTADATASGSTTLPNKDLRLWGSIVHMHTRGTAAEVDRVGGDCLLKLDQWSFHWQHFYWETQPVTIPAGSTVGITCHFDTGNDNTDVHFGEKTSDEMCIGFLYLTL